MEILYVGTLSPHRGGTAVVGDELVHGWAARGHRVRAIAPITDGDRELEAATALDDGLGHRLDPRRAGVIVQRYTVPAYDVSSQRSALADIEPERGTVQRLLRQAIAELRPDVVVAGRESFVWSVPEVAAGHGLPCVAVFHSAAWAATLQATPSAERSRAWLERAALVDRIVVVAAHLAPGVERLGLRRPAVVANGVDPTVFRPGPRDLDLARSLDLAPGDLVAVHTSNFKDVKRPLDIVAAAAIVARDEPRLRFLMVGDGEMLAPVRQAVADAGLEDRFRFTGWVAHAQVPALLRLSHLSLMPSTVEAFALAYLEALATGLVLVASDVPGAREVIVHGENALTHPVGDVEELARLLAMVASDPAERARLGAAGRRSAAAWDLASMVDRHLEVLASGAAEGRARDGSRAAASVATS